MVTTVCFQFDYLNNKKFLLDDVVEMHMDTLEEDEDEVPYITQDFKQLDASASPRFNNMLVNFSTSTVHVPTDVFDKCKTSN